MEHLLPVRPVEPKVSGAKWLCSWGTNLFSLFKGRKRFSLGISFRQCASAVFDQFSSHLFGNLGDDLFMRFSM